MEVACIQGLRSECRHVIRVDCVHFLMASKDKCSMHIMKEGMTNWVRQPNLRDYSLPGFVTKLLLRNEFCTSLLIDRSSSFESSP